MFELYKSKVGPMFLIVREFNDYQRDIFARTWFGHSSLAYCIECSANMNDHVPVVWENYEMKEKFASRGEMIKYSEETYPEEFI